MAIAFRTAQSNINIGGSPVQESFTTVTGDTYLIVGVANRFSGGSVTGVTFNSVALTQIGSTVTSGSYKIQMFALINPDIGTYNIVFTLSDGTNISYVAGAWTGAPTDLNLQSVGTNSTASGSSLATTNTAPTGWNILVASSYKSGGSTISASTGSTERTSVSSGDVGIGLYDSNASISGAQSMSVTATSASIILGIIATIANTSISQSDTNTTTDTIEGTGNIWFLTQSDTNVSLDANTTKKPFVNKEKDSPSTWTNKEKS